jgi:signal transduction histidine kinase
VRAHGVLRDEQPLRDLVGSEMLVEEQQHFDLPGGEDSCHLFRHAAQAPPVTHAVEEPPRDSSGEGGVPAGDPSQEGSDLLGRLRLEEVPGGAGANRREQVLLRIRGSQDDDLRRGGALADSRESGEAVHPGHRQVEQHEVGLQRRGGRDGARAVLGLSHDVESLLLEERRKGVSRQRVVVHDEDPLGHESLIGTRRAADKRSVDHTRSQTYRQWLLGEILLVCLLASATALFAASDSLQSAYELHDARIAFDTVTAVAAAFVCVLTSIRFLVEGRTLDLLLAAGFWSIAIGTVAFALIPVFGGGSIAPSAAWQLVGARLLGAGLIAIAPYVDGRMTGRRRSLASVGAGVAVLLAIAAAAMNMSGGRGSVALDLVEGSYVRLAALLLTGLWLVALVGFALRYRRYGRDFDSWMCLAATLAVFADLHLVLTPVVSSGLVLQGDFLRIVAYGVLLVGVWRAIGQAEFGRAVADERARVAREIHDGLAQYLFAISTQVRMLEDGASLDQVLPRLKRAATSAQQEARFAVLALSSAGGSARFDSALRRYIEVLTADGELEVELDVDPQVRLAPDEQIEVFRIVQEGLGNARRHADANHVDVSITQRAGRRVVTVSDDGVGFDETSILAGQGVENMRSRAAAIDGELTLHSAPGRGTAIEVVLRLA